MYSRWASWCQIIAPEFYILYALSHKERLSRCTHFFTSIILPVI